MAVYCWGRLRAKEMTGRSRRILLPLLLLTLSILSPILMQAFFSPLSLLWARKRGVYLVGGVVVHLSHIKLGHTSASSPSCIK